MTVYYCNLKVDIEFLPAWGTSPSRYRCRLLHCNQLVCEWYTKWRWYANYSAKGRIRQYKNGVRWQNKPPKDAKKWTVT